MGGRYRESWCNRVSIGPIFRTYHAWETIMHDYFPTRIVPFVKGLFMLDSGPLVEVAIAQLRKNGVPEDLQAKYLKRIGLYAASSRINGVSGLFNTYRQNGIAAALLERYETTNWNTAYLVAFNMTSSDFFGIASNTNWDQKAADFSEQTARHEIAECARRLLEQNGFESEYAVETLRQIIRNVEIREKPKAYQAITSSMTSSELADFALVAKDHKRVARVARGSGCSDADVLSVVAISNQPVPTR